MELVFKRTIKNKSKYYLEYFTRRCIYRLNAYISMYWYTSLFLNTFL